MNIALAFDLGKTHYHRIAIVFEASQTNERDTSS
jgi:hypothetical protein